MNKVTCASPLVRICFKGYAFDAANRLVGRTYPDGLNDTLTYDADSRLTNATSGRYGTSVTRSYDAGDRIVSEVQRVDNVNYTVGYAYDAANRKTSITYPDGSVSARTYTDRNQLKTAKLGTTLLATRVYDAGQRLTSTTFGNALVETRTYRPDNLVATITTPGINQLSYSYDANKRVTNEANPLLPAEGLTYGYDVEDRLTAFQRGPTASPLQTQSWSLSLVGNWASTTRDGVAETRTHSSVHEITTLTKSGTPQVPLNHDAKGNLVLNQNGQALVWDVENRLSSASTAPGLAGGQYKYDVLGRRLKKAVGTLSTVFVHDGDQIIAEYENGTIKRRYVYGTYIDEPLAMVSSTGTRYYHQNRIYHVMAMTNSSGQLAERYGYTPYGKRRVVSPAGATLAASAVGNQVGFTGRYHDGETGLTYFRARYMDAELGRFVGRDPIGYVDGPSLYGSYFVPANVDPTGEQWQGWAVREGGKAALKALGLAYLKDYLFGECTKGEVRTSGIITRQAPCTVYCYDNSKKECSPERIPVQGEQVWRQVQTCNEFNQWVPSGEATSGCRYDSVPYFTCTN
ncbi:MAG: RHS repeat-associated core domain-containing protein [Polyangiaceae bacterium]|nr:RHS repeat-associated core domain-containing protein [Polyangiaceae bacterium]